MQQLSLVKSLVSSVSTNGKAEPIGEFQAYSPAAGIVAKVYVEVFTEGQGRRSSSQNDDSDASAKLAAATATLRTAEATLHDLEQAGLKTSVSACPGTSSGLSYSSSRQQKISPPSTARAKRCSLGQ